MRRNAAALFTEVGGDAIAFSVEEGANSHLPTGIHVTAHDKLRLFCGIFALPPEFHLAIATLPVHLSLLIPLHRLQSI